MRVRQTKESMAEMARKSSGNGGGAKYLKIPDGTSTWRFLWERNVTDENGAEKNIPMYAKDASHFVRVMEGGKQVKKSLHCPRALYGSVYQTSAEQRKCPLCDFAYQHKDDADPEMKRLASELRAADRYLVNAYNVESREIGVLPLPYSIWKYFTSITEGADVPSNWDITSPWADEGGTAIKITKSGNGFSTKYEVKTSPFGAQDIMTKEQYSTLPVTIREKYGENPNREQFRAAVEEYFETQMYDLTLIVTPQTVASYADLQAAIPQFDVGEYSDPDWAAGAGMGDSREPEITAKTEANYFDGVPQDFIRRHNDIIQDYERKGQSELYSEAVKLGVIDKMAFTTPREELLNKIFKKLASEAPGVAVPKTSAAAEAPAAKSADDSEAIKNLFGSL